MGISSKTCSFLFGDLLQNYNYNCLNVKTINFVTLNINTSTKMSFSGPYSYYSEPLRETGPLVRLLHCVVGEDFLQ